MDSMVVLAATRGWNAISQCGQTAQPWRLYGGAFAPCLNAFFTIPADVVRKEARRGWRERVIEVYIDLIKSGLRRGVIFSNHFLAMDDGV